MFIDVASTTGIHRWMRFLPVFLDTAAGTVALVGTGPAAQNKLRLLCASGARVRWYTGQWGETAENRSDAGELNAPVEIITSDPAQADFSGLLAVVSTAGDVFDEIVAARARAASIPVNVVDRPDLSSFVFPAIIDRGNVVIAVSTGGAAPVLARRLREQIEALLPARIGALAALMARYRKRFAQKRHPTRSPRRFWEQIVDGPIGAAVLAGRSREAEAALARAVDDSAAPGEPSGIVYVVDADPGDPDLLTLRALHVLQNADVIFYDAQVSSAILDRARRDSERVLVGGELFGPKVINQLIVDYAGRGLTIVCLKSSNLPIVGRLDHLKKLAVPTIIIPGVNPAPSCNVDQTVRPLSRPCMAATSLCGTEPSR